jgi:hypothetical protein
MSREPQHTLLENISFTDNLPIKWSVLAQLPSDGEMQRHYRDDEELLQNVLLSADVLSQDGDEEESDSAQEHFKRLEARLDLLLSLVTEMMSRNGNLPPAQAVTISGQGLCVQSGEAADNGINQQSLLKIELYLDPQFPRPLTLYAQPVDVQAHEFTVKFSPMESQLQDLLDKYVFRQHRRAIALARRSENL